MGAGNGLDVLDLLFGGAAAVIAHAEEAHGMGERRRSGLDGKPNVLPVIL